MSNAAVLHADIDVVGPGAGIVAALRVGQHVAAMRAVVVDRLILRQQFDGAVDAVGHNGSPSGRRLRRVCARDRGRRQARRQGHRVSEGRPGLPPRPSPGQALEPARGLCPRTPSPRVKRPVAGAGAAFAIHPFRMVGPTAPSEGFQEPAPAKARGFALAGIQGAAPLGGVSGAKP